MIYRLKQFIYALTAKITPEDMKFIKTYLNEKEQDVFFQLRVYEQAHCVKVAKSMMADNEKSREADGVELIRIGLLHDIGKIKYPLNPVEKAVIVVLDKLTKGRIRKLERLKMVKCYYGHARLGYEILSEIGDYEEDFLQAVRNHHEPLPKNEKVRRLKACDDAA